jgi:hypothetical protein
MVIGVGSAIYVTYVQSSIHSSESDHMNAVGEAFIKLKSSISAMEIGQSSIANISMNTNYPPLVPTSGEVGTLSFLPGIAYHKGATSYTIMNNKGHVSGSLNALKADDNSYLEINQVIFNEKFPNTSDWTMYEVPPDNGGNAFFDTYGHTGDGTGSISVITSGQFSVSYVAAGTGSGTTGNPTPRYPTGLRANDLILMQVTVRDVSTTPTTPTGFTLLYGPDSTGYGRQWIYYKFSNGTETGTITVTIGGGSCKIARVYAFRNVARSSFTEGERFGSGTGKYIYAQSVTTTNVNRLAVSFVFVNDDNPVGSFNLENGGNWTEAVSEFRTNAGSDGCVQLQTATMATAGTISGGSYSMGASDPWGVRAFALIPISRIASTENAYWEHDFGDSLDNYPNVTLEAWFGKEIDYSVSSPTTNAAWWIEAETNIYPESKTLYAHQENTLISGTKYRSLTSDNADNTGTNLSVSTASAGRSDNQLWGRFVYPLAGISSIPASTWNLYYRSWYSLELSSTTNSPHSTSGGWTSPSNAYDDGGGNAYITSGTPSASENYNRYGFNIPAGSTITSVRVKYDAWCTPLGISFIGSASSTGNDPTSGSFSLPSGWAVGDVAVFWWYTFSSTKTFTPPSGVTQKQQASSSGYGRIYIGYRQLQSGDTTFGWTSNSVNNSTTIWGTSVFRGVDGTGDPFEAESGAPATFSGTEDPNPPAVTTVSSGAWVIPIFGKNNDYSSISPPTSYTSAGADSSASGNDASAGVAYRQITSPTTENPNAWALGGGSGSDDGYVWTGALKPANGQIRVDVSWDGGTNWSSKQVTSLTSSETTYWYDVTGATSWTSAMLNDNTNFLVRVDAYTVGVPSVVRLDWIPVAVTYTPPTAAHSDITILIRKSDGTIRHAIAGDVAVSDNITSTENTYSGTYLFNYNGGDYTVENDNDYLEIDYYCHVTSAALGTAYLKIDDNTLAIDDQTRVEDVLFVFAYPNINPWNTVLAVSTDVDESIGIPYWNKKSTLQTLPSGIEDGIIKIRAHMYDNLKPATNAIDTYLSLWTDDITLFAGPPFEVDTVLTSMLIIAPESVDNIVGTLAFLSNSPASYTLQIENSTGGWETFTDMPDPVSVDQNKVYWVETIGGANATTQYNDPRNYIYNNVINIRIIGHNDSSPFSLCLDYLDFQVNYKENSENYLASFYGSSGRLTFTMVNYSYPDQTCIYDDGAVIIAQQNSSVMASGGAPLPDLMYVEPGDGNNIEVHVNHFALTGFGSSLSRRGWSAISATVVDSYYLNQGANVPNVSIEIYTSPYTDQAWVNYLSGLFDDFDARGYNPTFSKDLLADTGGEHLTLTIRGKNIDNTTPDIYYYEKVTEVQVQLA